MEGHTVQSLTDPTVGTKLNSMVTTNDAKSCRLGAPTEPDWGSL
jgi:hypothetical protein